MHTRLLTFAAAIGVGAMLVSCGDANYRASVPVRVALRTEPRPFAYHVDGQPVSTNIAVLVESLRRDGVRAVAFESDFKLQDLTVLRYVRLFEMAGIEVQTIWYPNCGKPFSPSDMRRRSGWKRSIHLDIPDAATSVRRVEYTHQPVPFALHVAGLSGTTNRHELVSFLKSNAIERIVFECSFALDGVEVERLKSFFDEAGIQIEAFWLPWPDEPGRLDLVEALSAPADSSGARAGDIGRPP